MIRSLTEPSAVPPDSEVVLDSAGTFPLTYRPAHAAANLPEWAVRHADALRRQIHRHGALLFRGFTLEAPAGFTAVARAICPALHTEYHDLAPEQPDEGVYSSTVYPVEHPIHFHNESAQAPEWPLCMFFYCLRPALEGGATRLVDTRNVLAELDPETRDRFRQRPLTYVRNHYPHLDTHWQELYGTDDPREAEQKCRAAGLDFQWTRRDALRTEIRRPALLEHPLSREETFFHQLFLFHPAGLDPETRSSLERLFAPSDFPRSVTWPAAAAIDDALVRRLFVLYEKHAVDLQWQAGDLVMLDNALVAHARAQYRGPRKILVAMGNMIRTAPTPTSARPAAPPHLPDPAQPLPAEFFEPAPIRFRAVVRRQPEALAISQGDQTWTYQALEARARRVAGALRAAGVAPGAVVAVTGPRSFDLIAGWLGAWFHGAVVLPLDPELPDTRRQVMMEDARAAAVLYAGHPWRGFPGGVTLSLDQVPDDGATADADEPISPGEAAYVVFTSGTTGRPKGILGTHNGLAHFLDWQRATFSVSPGDRVAQLASLSFDVVLREIFLPLTSGATLCLPPPDLDLLDPWDWFKQEGITRLHAVPSLASVWLERPPTEAAAATLKTVFFAGEPLTESLVRRWRAVTPESLEIINLYGPTETTLATCWYRVGLPPEPGVQPIGGPLPGAQVLVVDDDGRPCPPGATGELAIRTPYRTRGYLRPDEARATRFAPNPFRDDPDDWIYFTGDLGRFRPDGALDILGRKDEQIKILGVRIEPQEIIAALVEHPGVRQASVVVRPGTPPSLWAYVAADERAAPPGILTTHLAARLPPAMIPTRFIYLDRLPLSPNGKINRRALPPPEVEARPATAPSPPKTDLERRLARLWMELLRVEDVHREDRFFDLGGHSLVAAQLAARVRAQFQAPLEIQHVFEHPSLAALAACIEQLRAVSRARPPILRRRATGPGPHPLSFAQEGLWFMSQLEPESGMYNIPGALRITGAPDFGLLQRCLDALVARHDALRTRFAETDGAPGQFIEEQCELILERRDLTGAPATLPEVAREFTRRPFDLSRAPLARAILLTMSPFDHALVYALHHTIADGWSNLLFNRELQALYAAGGDAGAAGLPARPIDYADYAHWERENFDGSAALQLAYWEDRLRDAPPFLEWPVDRPRPARLTFHSAACARTLPPGLTVALRAAAPESGSTLFMKMLALFQALLGQLGGTRDVVVGVPVARRARVEFESVLGCFINTLPIRTRWPEDGRLDELIQSVQSGVLEAFAHQDAPFDKIVERVRPPRRPNAHPIFQVLFNFLHFDEPVTNAGGVHLRREWLVDPETKFDMTLYVREQADTLHLHLVYNRDLFDAARVERWLAHYQRLLEFSAENSRSGLAEWPRPEPAAGFPRLAPPAPETVPAGGPEDTATEQALAEIWRDVLELDSVNRLDNFFALGGFSLRAVKLMARIRSVFGQSLPLRAIFEHPTVAELAARIQRGQDAQWPAITTGDPGALSVDQQCLWRWHRQGRDRHYFNVPRAFRLDGLLDAGALRAALETLVERHAVLRALVEDTPDGPRARVQAAGAIPWKEVVLDGRPDADAAERALLEREAGRIFDLAQEWPIRFTLVRRGRERHLLIINAHHIAANCWSVGLPFQVSLDDAQPGYPGLLMMELMTRYDQLRGGGGALPPLPIQFSDFARWQNERIRSGDFADQAAYWKNQLAGAPRVIRWPADFARPPEYRMDGQRLEMDCPAGIEADLRRFQRAHHTSLLAPLLGAYSLALSAWTGESDLVIGTPVGNRTHPETQQLIGPLGNVLPLRVRLDDRSASGRQLVHRLRHTIEGGLAHGEYPFAQLARDLEAEPTDHPPIFQARLVLQQAPSVNVDRAGLMVRPVPVRRQVSKYDLSLIVATDGRKFRHWIEYNTTLFKPSTITAFAGIYRRALLLFLRDDDRPVADLIAAATLHDDVHQTSESVR
jgi:amino acid adenylation domain-containing protein